jgi:hypothetical protein
MAELATVTYGLLDSGKRATSFSMQHRSADPSDGDVQAMATIIANITRLGVKSATVTRKVDISAEATDPENEANKIVTASLQVEKSVLRASHGGTYTFKLPHPKVALIDAATFNLLITNAAFLALVEACDDGAGIAGVVGDWYISDQEEIVEGVGGSNILKGFMDKKR